MPLNRVTLRGRNGSIVWGYHPAAECQTWTIVSAGPGTWALSAAVTRADAFKLRQRPLTFTAPRQGGVFCFPVLSVNLADASLAATLGPPEY